MKLQDIITAVQEYHPHPDIDLIRRAYAFVRQHHEGQTRASGEPYITHVTEVASLTTKLRLDVPSVVTALLHDTVEDTSVTLDEIEGQFGSDIRQLVDGVTKLSKVKFSSRAEEQAENFRKMLLAMSKDIRVLLIKLADRLHNMRTLEYLSEARRLRISQETQEIYAPLAHRLGIHWMKSELEDLCFRHLKPEIHENIRREVEQRKKERQKYVDEVVKLITRELEQNGIVGEVYGRPKHFFSIYQKMERQNLTFDEVHDLIGFRIIVASTRDCYAVLGVVHAGWKPIPGRFRDYVAMPKPNSYQSLHTTVIGPHGMRIEIQIRTPDMHETAEKGIAAHWVYKEDGKGGKLSGHVDSQFSWLKNLVESEQMLTDPVEFMSIVKEDLFPDEVFVFSPKGDVFALAAGSTPIDFAYHVHSEVGHHCSGARVNGQQVPLVTRLKNGDTVEIITASSQAPSKDWLNVVATVKAKQRIRGWLKQEERNRSVSVGRELLTKDLRKVKLHFNRVMKGGELERIAGVFGFRDVEMLLAEIGYGKLTTNQVLQKLVPDEVNLEAKLAKDDSAIQKIFQRAAKVFRDKSGIRVSGMEDMVFRFARCCEPLPGEALVGYVSRGRGVIVHTRGCPQTLSFDPQRLIEVSWDENVKTLRRVRITVHSIDQIGILATMTQSISTGGANIVRAEVSALPEGKAVNTFEVMIESATQLGIIVRSLERINGVLRVERHRDVWRKRDS